MTESKTHKSASGVLDQDQTDGVSSITSKARNVVKSRWSISDPKAMT